MAAVVIKQTRLLCNILLESLNQALPTLCCIIFAKEKREKKWDIELEINVLRRLKCMSANPQKAIYFQYLNIQRAFYIHQMVLLNPVFILVAEHSIIFVEKLITIVVKNGL